MVRPEIADLFDCADFALLARIALGQAGEGTELICGRTGKTACNGIARAVRLGGELRSLVFAADTGKLRSDSCDGMSTHVVGAPLLVDHFPGTTNRGGSERAPQADSEATTPGMSDPDTLQALLRERFELDLLEGNG